MRGLFFNAQPTTDIVAHPSGFDREYDSDDFNRYMGVFFGNGVFVHGDPDACKVMATVGEKPPADGISIRPGIVLVDGAQCHIGPADRVIVKPISTTDITYTSIMCRRNNSADVRGFELIAICAIDEYPVLDRDGDIYDMCLAVMDVEPDGTISWIKDLRNDPGYCGFAALTGQPPYYPPDDANLPYILWLYTLGYPMTAQQKAAVEGNPSLMAIYNQTRLAPASQAQAEAGAENTKFMTSLRVKQAVEKYGLAAKDNFGRKALFSLNPAKRDVMAISSALKLPTPATELYSNNRKVAIIGNFLGIAHGGSGGSSSPVPAYLSIYDIASATLVNKQLLSSSAYYYAWIGITERGNFIACAGNGIYEVSTSGNVIASNATNVPNNGQYDCIPIDVNRVLALNRSASPPELKLYVNGTERAGKVTSIMPIYWQSYKVLGNKVYLLGTNQAVSDRMALLELNLGTISDAAGVSLYRSVEVGVSFYTDRAEFCVFDGAYAYCWGSMSSGSPNTAYRKKIRLSDMTIVASAATDSNTYYSGTPLAAFAHDVNYLWIAHGVNSVIDRVSKFRKSDFSLVETKTSIGGVSLSNLPISLHAYVWNGSGQVNPMAAYMEPASQCWFGDGYVFDQINNVAYPQTEMKGAIGLSQGQLVIGTTDKKIALLNHRARELSLLELLPGQMPWEV